MLPARIYFYIKNISDLDIQPFSCVYQPYQLTFINNITILFCPGCTLSLLPWRPGSTFQLNRLYFVQSSATINIICYEIWPVCLNFLMLFLVFCYNLFFCKHVQSIANYANLCPLCKQVDDYSFVGQTGLSQLESNSYCLSSEICGASVLFLYVWTYIHIC